MDRRMQDCYFFYYSTCTKGEHCGFRHEPAALGCETVCKFWQEGKCPNQQCHLRHMDLKKNRRTIPCYWESQPSGCRKPHCSFLHRTARDTAPEGVAETVVRPRQEPVANLPQAAHQPMQIGESPMVMTYQEMHLY